MSFIISCSWTLRINSSTSQAEDYGFFQDLLLIVQVLIEAPNLVLFWNRSLTLLIVVPKCYFNLKMFMIQIRSVVGGTSYSLISWFSYECAQSF